MLHVLEIASRSGVFALFAIKTVLYINLLYLLDIMYIWFIIYFKFENDSLEISTHTFLIEGGGGFYFNYDLK